MSRRFAWIITIAYMLSAGAWIVFSDTLLGGMGLSAAQTASLGLAKGIGFVVVTGTVLYFAASYSGQKYADVNERLSAIIDVSPVPIIALDLARNVTLWNAAAERVFGWSAGEVLGRPNPIVPDDAREEHRDIESRGADGEVPLVMELDRVTKDGRTLLTRMFIAAIHDERGAVTGTMAVIEDITQRRAARHELERYRDHLEELVGERTLELQQTNEALQHATDAKDTFLASMSHELRTPLNSIIGFSGILLQGLAGPLNPEQSKQLSMVNSSGHHLLALINDVLDLVKVEAGQIGLTMETVQVVEALASVEGIVRPLAEEKHLALSAEGGEGLSFVTDRRRLEQILLNLLSNAVKFTLSGTIAIRAMAEGDLVRFEVSDTGVGIDADSLDRVFDEFVQIESPDTLRPEGTGLGLAISSRLAKLLGGRVFARSEAGVGSIFTLELPRVERATLPTSPPRLAAEQGSVILVHADSGVRSTISATLRIAGYRVYESVDVANALAVAAENPANCILLGRSQPHLDWWSDLDVLRANPATSHVPVVCIGVPVDTGERCIAEFAGYLMQPLDSAGLVAALEETMTGVSCSPLAGNEETA